MRKSVGQAPTVERVNKRKKKKVSGKISLILCSKVWMSLHHFHETHLLLNDIVWPSPILNFTQTDKEIWEVLAHTYLHP